MTTNYDQFSSNFDMACKTTQRVSVPNLKLFGSMKTELCTQEILEFCIMFCGKMGWCLATNMAATILVYGDSLNFKQP